MELGAWGPGLPVLVRPVAIREVQGGPGRGKRGDAKLERCAGAGIEITRWSQIDEPGWKYEYEKKGPGVRDRDEKIRSRDRDEGRETIETSRERRDGSGETRETRR